METAKRDRRLLEAARFLLDPAHNLTQTARIYGMSPTWLSRSLRANLPRLDPELSAAISARLADLQSQAARLGATARWARAGRPLPTLLREQTAALLEAARRGDRPAASAAAQRVTDLAIQIVEGDPDGSP